MKEDHKDLYTVNIGLKFGNISVPSGYQEDVVSSPLDKVFIASILKNLTNTSEGSVLSNIPKEKMFDRIPWLGI